LFRSQQQGSESTTTYRASTGEQSGQDTATKGDIDGSRSKAEEDYERSTDEDDLTNDTFPFKVYRMLTKAEQEGKDDIVSFVPSGKAFRIHKQAEFATEIMPEYFTTSRLSSFQRQLNLYGFRRIGEGSEKGGYHHEHFQKGCMSLCRKIKRQKTTKKSFSGMLGDPPMSGSFGGGTTGMLAGRSGGSFTIQQLLAEQAGLGARNPLVSASLGLEHQIASLRAGAVCSGSQPGLNAALSMNLRQQIQQRPQQHQADIIQRILLCEQLREQQEKYRQGDNLRGPFL
jgi:hypothetical protein